MKKVHILTQEENKLSSKQLEEYMEFAAKNNYELTGELHFHFSNAFLISGTISPTSPAPMVTTTGASLIYASKYLKAAGAIDVKCLSMAKNIGNLYT